MNYCKECKYCKKIPSIHGIGVFAPSVYLCEKRLDPIGHKQDCMIIRVDGYDCKSFSPSGKNVDDETNRTSKNRNCSLSKDVSILLCAILPLFMALGVFILMLIVFWSRY